MLTIINTFSGNLPFIKSLTNDALFATFPEVKPVYQTLQKTYPNYDVGYNVNYNTFYSKSGPIKTSTLLVELSSIRDIPTDDKSYNNVGKLVCTILQKENKHIDTVGVHFSHEHKFLGITFYHTFYGYSGTCNYWLKQK